MATKIRKSVDLGNGSRANISKSGVGFSVGTKGARYSVGPSGTRSTYTAPGTGMSYEKRSSKKSHAPVTVAAIVIVICVFIGLFIFFSRLFSQSSGGILSASNSEDAKMLRDGIRNYMHCDSVSVDYHKDANEYSVNIRNTESYLHSEGFAAALALTNTEKLAQYETGRKISDVSYTFIGEGGTIYNVQPFTIADLTEETTSDAFAVTVTK